MVVGEPMVAVAGVGLSRCWFAAKWFARVFVVVGVVAGCSRRAVVAIETGRKVDRNRLELLEQKCITFLK